MGERVFSARSIDLKPDKPKTAYPHVRRYNRDRLFPRLTDHSASAVDPSQKNPKKFHFGCKESCLTSTDDQEAQQNGTGQRPGRHGHI